MRLHKEGWWYCIIATLIYATVLWLIFSVLSSPVWIAYPLTIILGAIWFWVFWFFRIPTRNKTFQENAIISPCDGKVVVIEETTETEYFKDKRLQISIFMSPLNVHVNTYPMAGEVAYVKYHQGKYLVAWHPKSSTENERSTIVLKNNSTAILIRQIAGAVARRICVYAQENKHVKQNDELGFIKFGSRVDLYLPIGTKVNVKIGDIVQNSVSVIANL